MKTFLMTIHDTAHTQTIDEIVSFVGEDLSGSFGILAGRERFITCLSFGMARLRTLSGQTLYLAMPGGVLSFADNSLTISTRHFVDSDNFKKIQETLQQDILDEEIQLQTLKKSFHAMENELMKRLLRTGQSL
jgi:F-type H+-transporting ATPase subunit epsilon